MRYRFEGKRKEVTIGSYKDFPLSAARDAAEELRRKIAQKIDPGREKIAHKATQEAGGIPSTFRQLSEVWYLRKIEPNKKHPQKVKGVLDKWINPKLGKIHPADITAAQVVDCIENIINSSSPTVANDARCHIKKMLRYGLVLGWLPVNVAADINQDIVGFTEQARSRHLSINEIKKLFDVMAKSRDWFGRDNELATRLLLMLGVRKNELIAATWSEIDFNSATWSIPPERSKTKNGFTVPFPPVAMEYLKEIQVRACGSEFVFPSRRRGRSKRRYISTDTLNATLHSLDHGIDPFTVHDLRRTMRTQLSVLGIRFEAAERCLNHTLKGTARVYDQHDFIDERRDALQRWCDVLMTLDQEGVRSAKNTINNQKIVYFKTAS